MVVITVFDPAGNSDRSVWTVDVTSAGPSPSSGMTAVAGIGLVVILVAAVVVLRLRRARPSGQSTVTAEPLSEEAQAEEAKALITDDLSMAS